MLTEALRWWGDLPALVPAGPTGRVRAMMHALGDPEVREAPEAENGSDFSYVMPDTHFATMTLRKGGVMAAANAGGVVVRTYLVTKKWLPTPASWSKQVRVRGRDGILTEYRPTDGSPPFRDLTWYVPHGEDYVVWYVGDDPERRSEADLLSLIEALVEA